MESNTVRMKLLYWCHNIKCKKCKIEGNKYGNARIFGIT